MQIIYQLYDLMKYKDYNLNNFQNYYFDFYGFSTR